LPNADQTRILVIANRTASTPTMLDKVAERARAGASFALLIPPEHGDDEDWSQEVALKLVGRAAGSDVACLDSGDDPLDTVHRAVSDGEFDELIVCTAPAHLARWVHHDLPHRLQHLQQRGVLADDAVEQLVIDLSGITFIDSSGLSVLVYLKGRCDERGIDLLLRDVPLRARTLIDSLGLSTYFKL